MSAYWLHARLFEVADTASKAGGKTSVVISPNAFTAVQKFDAMSAAERTINGLSPAERPAARGKDVVPLVFACQHERKDALGNCGVRRIWRVGPEAFVEIDPMKRSGTESCPLLTITL